jgi:nicotinamide riboside transporter PnuC
LKYLLVLGIIAIIFYALLFWRMRRYFPVARQIFSIARQLYRLNRKREDAQPVESRQRQTGDERLVRCTSCGTWIPSDRAVQLRGKSPVYCSTSCMEQSASAPAARRSAKG